MSQRTSFARGHCCREYRRANFSLANAYESPAPVAHPKPAAGASLLAASRRPIHRTRSNITTLRSLSALMIFSFGGLSPVNTMLTIEGATPLFLAHSFWPPARFTSERSKRTTSFWSSARMSVFGTAASVGGLGALSDSVVFLAKRRNRLRANRARRPRS